MHYPGVLEKPEQENDNNYNPENTSVSTGTLPGNIIIRTENKIQDHNDQNKQENGHGL